MIGFCPEAEGLSVLANFTQKKDKQTRSSFLTPAKGGGHGGSTERGHLGHTAGLAGTLLGRLARSLFLNRPHLMRFSFQQELSC